MSTSLVNTDLTAVCRLIVRYEKDQNRLLNVSQVSFFLLIAVFLVKFYLCLITIPLYCLFLWKFGEYKDDYTEKEELPEVYWALLGLIAFVLLGGSCVLNYYGFGFASLALSGWLIIVTLILTMILLSLWEGRYCTKRWDLMSKHKIGDICSALCITVEDIAKKDDEGFRKFVDDKLLNEALELVRCQASLREGASSDNGPRAVLLRATLQGKCAVLHKGRLTDYDVPALCDRAMRSVEGLPVA
ncbi:MAG: hypothetical protein PHS53_03125 [Candidatus Pacebacteria bacterium]|nr:hypothetical protein [Candidatus Paceibacterota bacterium]